MRIASIVMVLLSFMLPSAAAAVDRRIVQGFGRPEVSVLERVGEVEVFRVEAKLRTKDSPEPPETDLIDGFPILARGPTKHGKNAVEVANTLLSPSIYAWGYRKGCGFSPAVALRFWKAGSHASQRPVDVFVCLQCDEISVTRPARGTGLSRGHELHDIFPGPTLEIDPGHKTMLKLIAGLLPDDPVFRR
jgi:hypothetical protein